MQRVLESADERTQREIMLRMQGFDAQRLARYVEDVLGSHAGVVFEHGRFGDVVTARSLFCYWAVKELGMKVVDLAHELELTPSTISITMRRGEHLAKERGLAPPGHENRIM